MPNVIKIKRSTGSAAPSSLSEGELAYTFGDDKMYIGAPASSVREIPGKAALDKLNLIEPLADVTDATNVDAAGATMNADFNANTILIAVSDNVPLPVTE